MAWLEARASNEGGMIGDEATKALRKGDRGEVLVAALLRRKTTVGNRWIAERLPMGHHGSVSRLVVAASQDQKHERELRKLIKMLKCVT